MAAGQQSGNFNGWTGERAVIFEGSLAKPKPSAGEALLAAGKWNVRDRRNKGGQRQCGVNAIEESVHHVRSGQHVRGKK
ncbi:uncharacterized protein TrAtP1_011572 [Trichoderma atroviride]|uniref:uncharacterized protein n=1 Tax=Hypocrea atroviridis TaxID=63577 RepID=UPI00332A8975|nr:hypothetical protein TrAtP1_011572 [Trichoderma atroviride]